MRLEKPKMELMKDQGGTSWQNLKWRGWPLREGREGAKAERIEEEGRG